MTLHYIGEQGGELDSPLQVTLALVSCWTNFFF